MRSKITSIDIPDHDTIHALEYLLTLARENRIAGMIFALSMKNERRHPHLCGATGRLAANQAEAAGVASMLHLKLSQESLDASIRGK